MTVPVPTRAGQRPDALADEPGQIWSAYIRYIGAGAVLASGLITLGRTIPTIISSFRESMKGLGAGRRRGQRPHRARPAADDRPRRIAGAGHLPAGGAAAADVRQPAGAPSWSIVFGFFFVSVSSRITGLIGNSSNPISGMTIATLILTCTIFVALGWTGDVYAPIALCVGAVVCIASAIAGATSQDLKTGFLVGATPIEPADRPADRRLRVGARHRLHDALSAIR